MKRWGVLIPVLMAATAGLLVALSCTSTPTQASRQPGGSGTETVGILVDPKGHPLASAKIAAFPVAGATSDSLAAPETTAVTNASGIYTFVKLPIGSYRCLAASSDSAFVGIFSFARPDTDSLYLGTDTLYPPGKIAGVVIDAEATMNGTTVYLPGTSYLAMSDDTGRFTLGNVPPGTYRVYFLHAGNSLGKDSNVIVLSNQVTSLPPMRLAVDPAAPPPAPKNLRCTFDTTAGVVTLMWDPVYVSDLDGYSIHRITPPAPARFTPDQGQVFPAYRDTLPLDPNDSTPVTVRYEIQTVDTLGNTSQLSLPVDIAAPSAWFITTRFTWIKVPDTVTNADQFSLAVKYRNPTRSNTSLRWYTGSSAVPIKIMPSQARSGYDTLVWKIATPGLIHMRVTAADDAGGLWSDSIALDILD
jgi:hypothetical protein